jgi:hypothetical protein
MTDFFNNNASAIFAFLTLIVTLFVPYIGKIFEAKYQRKKDNLIERKTTYETFIHLFANFDETCDLIGEKYANYLLTLDDKVFRGEPSSIDLSKLTGDYSKGKKLYKTTTNLSTDLEIIVLDCIQAQKSIIQIIEICGHKPDQEKYELLIELRKIFKRDYFNFKKAIKTKI